MSCATYSAAGRQQTRSESGAGANPTPTQYVYNSTYGYLSEIDSPAGKETNLQYDPSGSLLGQVASPNSTTTTYESTYTYTVRGELRTSTQPTTFNQTPPAVNILANAVAVNTNYAQPQKTVASWQDTVDPRMGASLGSRATYTDGSDTGQSVTFDPIGRDIEDDAGSDPPSGCDTCQSVTTVTTRSYDQDNHVLTTGTGGTLYGPASATYNWGANGHPVVIGAECTTNVSGCPAAGTMGYETLHWDGDQLLFSTRGALVDDIKVGIIGDITPQDTAYAGLTFWDRDASNTIVYCHNATGGGGNGKPSYSYSVGKLNRPLVSNPCAGLSTSPASMLWSMASGYVPTSSTTATMIGWGGVLAMPRSDGFIDGFNQIQGVRSFDGQMGEWTTPDAYEGTSHDPMSQKGYVWNRGNALSYNDPSGYTTSSGLGTDPYEPNTETISFSVGGSGHHELTDIQKMTASVSATMGWAYDTEDEAAYGAAFLYGDTATAQLERGTLIYEVDGAYNFVILKDNEGWGKTITPSQLPQPGCGDSCVVGMWHSHGPLDQNTSEWVSFMDHPAEIASWWHKDIYTTIPTGNGVGNLWVQYPIEHGGVDLMLIAGYHKYSYKDYPPYPQFPH